MGSYGTRVVYKKNNGNYLTRQLHDVNSGNPQDFPVISETRIEKYGTGLLREQWEAMGLAWLAINWETRGSACNKLEQ
jgi:hypothetical protein